MYGEPSLFVLKRSNIVPRKQFLRGNTLFMLIWPDHEYYYSRKVNISLQRVHTREYENLIRIDVLKN